MRRQRIFASIGILTIYTALVMGWLVVAGSSALEGVLFFLLGLPIVAAALWWSGRDR